MLLAWSCFSAGVVVLPGRIHVRPCATVHNLRYPRVPSAVAFGQAVRPQLAESGHPDMSASEPKETLELASDSKEKTPLRRGR